MRSTMASSETAGTRGQVVRSISVLGATGSVGQSTIDLICRNRDAFTVEALTAQTNVAALAEAARRTGARLAVIGDANLYDDLRAALAGTGIDAAAGPDAIVAAAAMPADCVVAAIVGAAGLAPTLEAARQGRRLALANKECLVSAGDVFMSTVADAGCELLPVDSEHSGALQALAGASAESIERITLTASGGPFRTWSLDELQHVTPEQALRHPNWSMGAKITIDSATLMNKGLELIEAYHLFPVTAEQLGAVVHPQSIIHCLVSYIDGSVMAQMACPDMRTPIALALSWPGRMAAPTQRLDLASIGQLSFEAPDEVRFPALKLARDALTRGATAPAILSAANEVAVEAFLSRRIGFLDIARNVADALEAAEKQGLIAPAANLGDVLEADSAGRRLAQSLLGRYV